jgi:2-dehydropantoate 2-reductase
LRSVGGFGASMVAPGHVHHNGWEFVRLGERHGPATPRIRGIAKTWADAGFRVQIYDDVDQLVWEKLVCNVCFSGTCTILERPIRDVLNDSAAWHVASGCAQEAYEVACARGITLDFDDPVAYARTFGETIPHARPSMLLDLLAGRPCEIDVINGAIPPAARELGLAAPVNETVTALVKAKSPNS